MPIRDNKVIAVLIFFTFIVSIVNPVLANKTDFPLLTLENDILQLQLTPNIGGRVSYFSLKSHNNFINTGAAFTKNIIPEVSPFADNIGYLGHIVWVGPQSQWWQQQQVNQDRLNNKANWPPDPYTIFAKNTVTLQSKNHITLQGVNSSVTGLRLDKEFSLTSLNPNQVNLTTTATNISQTKRAWDLWFNTRVQGDTYIVASVNNKSDVRVESFEQAQIGPIAVNYINKAADDYFVEFDVKELTRNKVSNKGKIFIQPNQGWLAGFNNGQLFIIAFPWQEKEHIHAEHGQIEIYADYQPQNLSNSLIEMEFHGPYQQLQPKQQMRVEAKWYLFPYPNNWNKQQMLDFLQTKITAVVEPKP